jgi:hypothetical protein
MMHYPKIKKPPAYARGPEGGKNEVLEETITCAVNRFDILRRILIFAKLLP